MVVLVLNCGSSSIKYQVMRMENADAGTLLAKGIVERIGLADGTLTHKPEGKTPYATTQNIPNHTVGIDLILQALVHAEHGVIASLNEINAVGHRVAHGGEFFKESALVNASVKARIEQCAELAPLHNPANLLGITSMEKLLPAVPQVAVFDTSFHQTIPDYAYLYAIPRCYYEQHRIRRYGFHGTSHRYVAQKACKILGLDFGLASIVTCHLGNGASIASIAQGKSVDTSMGFTPLDGLVMGTRSGTIDPGALFYIAEKEGKSVAQLNDLLNKKSGLQGVSGLSSDMRDLRKASDEGNADARLALEMFSYSVRKFIGLHAAALGNVDVIIFTGGIGENDDDMRANVCSHLGYLGATLNAAANKGLRGKDALISTPDSRIKIMTITTNEELVIAMDTMRLTSA